MIRDNDYRRNKTSEKQDAEKMGDTPPGDSSKVDPLLALVGSGRDLWADEHADEYVARLRQGWK